MVRGRKTDESVWISLQGETDVSEVSQEIIL